MPLLWHFAMPTPGRARRDTDFLEDIEYLRSPVSSCLMLPQKKNALRRSYNEKRSLLFRTRKTDFKRRPLTFDTDKGHTAAVQVDTATDDIQPQPVSFDVLRI